MDVRFKSVESNLIFLAKWTLTALLIGTLVGVVGAVFRKGVELVTANWNARPWMIALAPVSGCLIVLITKLLKEEKNGGTNTVIDSVTEGKHITERTAPMIFISTLLSHLTGASVGKEGAALMIGGGMGEIVSNFLKFDKNDRRIAIMCGMSACFASVFGTPLAATVFPMEVISIGTMYYAALIPCIFSAFFGAGVSAHFGNHAEVFPVVEVPAFDITQTILVVILGLVCALVAIFFSWSLHQGHHLADHALPNPYIRAAVGGLLLILLTILNRVIGSGGFDFNGGGFPLAEKAMEGEAVTYAFLLKILFTTVCIACGFKGGEIVPTLCIGACVGSLFAGSVGADTRVYAAAGMAAMFAGMTNSPISSLLLAFELFGYTGMPYFAIAIAVCFTLSGYYGLYSSQRFAYSKTRTVFIDRKGPRRLWDDSDTDSLRN